MTELPPCIYPYDEGGQFVAPVSADKHFWLYRSTLASGIYFGKTKEERGLDWREFGVLVKDKLHTPLSIVFGFVATHNHFALDRGGKVFKQSAPVIKLPKGCTDDEHLALVGLLNSSIACFWMQQTMHNKGGPGGASSKDEKWHDFFEFSGTQLQQYPLPSSRPLSTARKLDQLATELAANLPAAVVSRGVPTHKVMGSSRNAVEVAWAKMIALQEELDWECYGLYGLLADPPLSGSPPPLKLGQRAFEIILARQVSAGELETKWFDWLGIPPTTEIPHDWPKEYRDVVHRRIELIEKEPKIDLIENVRCKRRWESEPWEIQQAQALKNWPLHRLESCFDLDGRMGNPNTVTARGNLLEPRLISLAKVADLAKQDKDFIQVAELYAGRMDFDVTNLVGGLITAESVPYLPVLRYKPSGLDKRAAWERTWELQRLEDSVDALFDMEWLKQIEPGMAEATLRPLVAALRTDEQRKPQVLREAVRAAGYVAEAAKQKSDPLSLLTEAAKRARQQAVGDIAVPPKYTSADFLGSNFWRLRGKLDVPKERWVIFPHCEGEDGALVIAWAGYDHLQLARAIAERYEQAKEHEGRRLVPLLACIGRLTPWLKQWYNELDPAFGTRMGDYFENYLAEESKALGVSVDQVMAWTPPANAKKAGRKKKVEV